MPRLNFKYINNIRDLGGFITNNNHITKTNIFIRSEILNKLNAKEIKYLINHHIRTVIDFRSKEETEINPSYLNNNKYFKYYNIALKGDSNPLTESDIPLGYMDIINDKETVSKTFNILINSKGGVIYHCTSGKDRTGVITMLLLLMVDVQEDDILADYSISYIYIRDKILQMHLNDEKLSSFVGQSKYTYMEETLKLFYKKYGSIINYENYLGLTEKDILKLKKKFLK